MMNGALGFGAIASPLIASQFPIAARTLFPSAVLETDTFHLQAQTSSLRAWFTDMDGTLFNSKFSPDEHAAATLHHIAQQLTAAAIPMVYVTGRFITSIDRAIATFKIPTPRFAAAATGSVIYERVGETWKEVEAYTQALRSRWVDRPDEQFDRIMTKSGAKNWKLQFREPMRHIYVSDPDGRTYDRQRCINDLLVEAGLKTIQVVVCEGNDRLFHYDFIPDNGSKLHAARFIAEQLLGLGDLSQVLFTGDSGNDCDLLLASGFATLVQSSEEGLRDLLMSRRPDIQCSPYEHIYGVLHSMLTMGALRAVPVVSMSNPDA